MKKKTEIPAEGKCIAIIPARGGSKRIPHKNIREFCGQPLLAYSVKVAVNSGLFDRVLVSTDDPEIAEAAVEAGAEVPFYRSAETACDTATTSDALLEVLERLGEDGEQYDLACCIYATAPFLTGDVLRTAKEKLEETGADTVMPVVAYSFPPQRGMVLRDGKVFYTHPECRDVRSQDLEKIYHDAGQFYFFRVAPFMESGVLVSENTAGIEVPELMAQDIDTEEDLLLAEFKFRFLQRKAKDE